MATIMNRLRGLNNGWPYEMELEGTRIVSSRNADEKAVIFNRLHEMIEFRAEAQKIEAETLQATCPSLQSQPAKIFETPRRVLSVSSPISRWTSSWRENLLTVRGLESSYSGLER